jgi:hypothetical protein
MWICAAGDSAPVGAGVVDFANINLFYIGFILRKTAIQNFKCIKLLYIIDIKSGLDCQFHLSKYSYNSLILYNYLQITVWATATV